MAKENKQTAKMMPSLSQLVQTENKKLRDEEDVVAVSTKEKEEPKKVGRPKVKNGAMNVQRPNGDETNSVDRWITLSREYKSSEWPSLMYYIDRDLKDEIEKLTPVFGGEKIGVVNIVNGALRAWLEEHRAEIRKKIAESFID